jgi:hypothetical protein
MNTGQNAPPAWNLAIPDSWLHTFRTMALWTGCTPLKTKRLKSQKND